MSWIKKLNPFAKDDAPAGAPEVPDGAEAPPPGMMAAFFRKWKDPAFIKQMRALAVRMQREGVDIRDRAAVQAWLEKNKELLEKGLPPEETVKPGETFVKTGPEVGRNDPCHCGSGKKFKKCHGSAP